MSQADKSKAADIATQGDGILMCRHCGSIRINPRNSSNESESVQFKCAACSKYTNHKLPDGYIRSYIRDDLFCRCGSESVNTQIDASGNVIRICRECNETLSWIPDYLKCDNCGDKRVKIKNNHDGLVTVTCIGCGKHTPYDFCDPLKIYRRETRN